MTKNITLFAYGFAVILLSSSLFPVRTQEQDQDVIRAKKFVIENPDGSKEMSIRANKGGPGVVLTDSEGNAVVGVASHRRGVSLMLKKMDGAKIQLGASGERSTIRFLDKSNNVRLQMQNTQNAPRIQMLDQKGNVRKELQYPEGEPKEDTSEDESSDTKPSNTDKAPEPELTVGSQKLYEEFSNNLIKANETYLDKWIVLTGNVKAVNKDATGYFVKLKTEDGYFSHKCYFPESRNNELADLSGDQYVKILGKVTSGDDTGAILKQCRIKQGAGETEIPESFLQSRIFVRWGIADFDEGFTPDRFRTNYRQKGSSDITLEWNRVGQKRYMLQVYAPEEDKTTEIYFKHRDDHSRITKVHLKGVEGKDLYTDWQKISRFLKVTGLSEVPKTEEE